jgi:hypothetical protein
MQQKGQLLRSVAKKWCTSYEHMHETRQLHVTNSDNYASPCTSSSKVRFALIKANPLGHIFRMWFLYSMFLLFTLGSQFAVAPPTLDSRGGYVT